jgi:predicted RNA-binding Zn ribbon-like protein
MDDGNRRRLGEGAEPGGRQQAPGRIGLLQRFVNTYNHDFPDDWDRLGTPAKAGNWLRHAGLTGGGVSLSDDDAARLRDFREAVRGVVIANQSGRPNASSADALRSCARSALVRIAIDDAGRTSLETDRPGVEGAIASLLAIMHEAQLGGEWTRLKGCRQCGYAFFDRSKNRSAVWCAMSICGNRAKNRAYYRRRAPVGRVS